MKISCNWLQDWVDLDGIDRDELAHRLTMAGLEVEQSTEQFRDHSKIVVGKILEIESHPNADRLVCCEVSEGSRKLSIVCGATNMDVGDLIPVALPGSQPPGVDFEIVAREVRGESSEGMLCSKEELELADDSEGLFILPDYLADSLGKPVYEALGLADHIYEFDLTPNRSDCLSHLGVAREISALFERPLKTEDKGFEEKLWLDSKGEAIDELASLSVEASHRCSGYLCAVLEDVEVTETPWHIQRRLASIGIRSLNNIVDVTNFVLFDTGQPLHAFDLDRLSNDEIRVRLAKEGETIEAIDHETYELDSDDLVIADADRPVAIAGVMGGADTEVSEQTERILLECAYFNPQTVRRSSKRHKLHTDSSHRFERGIDSGRLEPNLSRAVHLLSETSPDPVVASGILGSRDESLDKETTILLSTEDVEQLMGASFSQSDIRDFLERIELDVEESSSGAVQVTVPTHRPDLTRSADLIEEIARLRGYDRIEPDLPDKTMGDFLSSRPRSDAEVSKTIQPPRRQRVERRIRKEALSWGLDEVINTGFVSIEEGDRFHLEQDWQQSGVELDNPLVESQRWLRQSLLPGLIDNARRNQNHGIQDLSFFEFGSRYFSETELETLGMLVGNRRKKHWSDQQYWDFYDVKGLIEDLCHHFDLDNNGWQKNTDKYPFLHPGVSAEWLNKGDPIAYIGQLHPKVTDELDLGGNILVGEVYLDKCFSAGYKTSQFESISRYPSVVRDFALVYDRDSLSYGDIEESIQSLVETNPDEFGQFMESFELFDTYQGDQLGEGERSIALRMTYRSDSGTLTDEQVSVADKALTDWLSDRLGIRQR